MLQVLARIPNLQTAEDLVATARLLRESAEMVEAECSPSRWGEADCYAKLAGLGWNQRKIAVECGVSQTSVCFFIQCVKRDYLGNQRPSFWTAYQEVKKGAHVDENTGVPEWYTPEAIIEAAKTVLGEIDLDPATSEAAQKMIQAKKYFTKKNDGLLHTWHGRVWLNPPYSQPAIGQFCEKLIAEREAGRISSAMTLTNNATETRWGQLLLLHASAVCFHAGRIAFWRPNKESICATPLQGQMLCYFGTATTTFLRAFGEFGVIR